MKTKEGYLKISVITVCLNAAEHLERAIQSVVRQGYPNVEYIIIDGKSEDGTVDIIKRYERHVAYWVSEKDAGIYYAMNKGLEQCTGDVVVFLGSDDYFLEDSFEYVNQYFKDKPETQVLCCEIWHNDRGTLKPVVREKGRPIAENLRYYMNGYSHQGIFARRDLFLQFGAFDTEHKLVADYEWLLRVYNRGVPLIWSPKRVAAYGLEGVSTLNKIRVAWESREIACRAAREFGQKGDESKAYKYSETVIYNCMSMYLVRWCNEDFSEDYSRCVKAWMRERNVSKVIIMGCGAFGKECFLFLQKCGIEILAFWDNYYQNESFCGVRVERPNRYKKKDGSVVLVAICEKYQEIAEQLTVDGLEEECDFFCAGAITQGIAGD